MFIPMNNKSVKNALEVQHKTNTLSMLQTLAKAIENDEVSKYTISQTKDGVTEIIIDSSDSQSRVIQKTIDIDGYSSRCNTVIQKLRPNERLRTVERLDNLGKTQAEIAKETMVSQKTISNDIKKLKNRSS